MQKKSTNYKVVVNNKHGVNSDRNSCRLQISLGVDNQTGEKFFELCEWASRRFDSFTVIVSDSLQRHNIRYREGISLEDAEPSSLVMGDEWIKDNKEALDLLPDLTITRWNDWLSHEDYSRYHQEMWNRYETEKSFRRDVNIRIYSLWHKWHNREPEAYPVEKKGQFFDNSLNLLIEELAIFPIMFRQDAIDIYAGSWFYDLFITLMPLVPTEIREPLDRASCYEVDFKRRKAKAA